MDKTLENFINSIKDPAKNLMKDELKKYLKDIKDETDSFTKEQAAKMEKYMVQLAQKKITKKQFEIYMLDMQDLIESKKLEAEVKKNASIQRLSEGLTNLVIEGLLKAIKCSR